MKLFKTLILGFGTMALIGCAGGTKLQTASVDNIPEWYLTPPANTAEYIYAVNSQSSQDMQIAVDKASTGGRAEVQRQVEANIQAMQKKFNEEIGTSTDATLLQQFTQAEKIVTQGVVNGSVIKEKKIKQDGNLFRAYVLIQYPLAAANKALVDELKKNEALYTTLRSSKAFDELEKEVEKTKAQ